MKNIYYSPESFKVIQSLMHIIPLWSCMFLKAMKEFGCLPRFTPTGPFNNGIVESHFKSVKHGTLSGRKRLRPQEFLLKTLTYTQGKLNETILPKNPRIKKKNIAMEDQEEQWKPAVKHKSRKYSDVRSAQSVFLEFKGKKNKGFANAALLKDSKNEKQQTGYNDENFNDVDLNVTKFEHVSIIPYECL